jgi:hypothetical protein
MTRKTYLFIGGFLMRIDMKRAAEVNQRKGLTGRMLLTLLWLALCLVLAYFFTGWLFDSGVVDFTSIYNALSLPEGLGPGIVRLMAIVILVVALQFTAVVVMAMAKPEARERTGRPTAVAQSVDFYEQQYSRRA